MSLADRYIKPDTRSKFERWLDSLNADNRKVVDRWLADKTISSSKIVEMIADDSPEDDFAGYKANKDTVSAWRRAHGTR